MKLLFVHQNMPGQYRELVQWLAAQGGHEIVFLTQRKKPPEFAGVRTVIYKTHHKPGEKAYGLSKTWETAAGAGFGAAMALREIVASGFTPDIIIGHVGWGEMTFMKDVLPNVPQIGFFEYYYSVSGGPVGLIPKARSRIMRLSSCMGHNVVPNMNIESVDVGHSPMYWQRNRFPKSFHEQDLCLPRRYPNRPAEARSQLPR